MTWIFHNVSVYVDMHTVVHKNICELVKHTIQVISILQIYVPSKQDMHASLAATIHACIYIHTYVYREANYTTSAYACAGTYAVVVHAYVYTGVTHITPHNLCMLHVQVQCSCVRMCLNISHSHSIIHPLLALCNVHVRMHIHLCVHTQSTQQKYITQKQLTITEDRSCEL
jgi:hypothetical protein